MFDVNGNYRCDAEIGSIRNGWHCCGKPATVESNRLISLKQPAPVESHFYTLHYCERHANRAADVFPGGSIQLLSVKPIR